MPGRTPYAAWLSYVTPLNKALLCIARQKSFVVKELSAGLMPGTRYAVTLNDMNSVPLQSSPKIYLVAGQNITIYDWLPEVPDERYRVQTQSYFYAFTTESIVRFAIMELNVAPQNRNWKALLDASELAFEQHKTD